MMQTDEVNMLPNVYPLPWLGNLDFRSTLARLLCYVVGLYYVRQKVHERS